MWGKLFGTIIGFMAGRIVGAVIGFWLGHLYDSRSGNSLFGSGSRRELFFMSTFAVMGHMAKKGGRVTEQDIALANHLMDQLGLSGDKRRQAQAAFRNGKSAGFKVESVLKDLRRLSLGRTALLQMFLEIQIQTALSDGRLQDDERELLQLIALTLGFSPSELSQLLSRWQAEQRAHQYGEQRSEQAILDDAYQVLGVDRNISFPELKRVYRRLMSEHHPDKLVAKGLPNEMMDIAKQKTQDIKAAYEVLKRHHSPS
ncbi:co-chaperone protein DjlA [Paraferrimonas sedimenticola]|uniref:Co-chaperone protein DjlA n=2 Tax=Paraferrimonas sedimenticola TaxID=375674 RepID=A0AA37RYZ2_9GAMM|nr:co-chaperone protein DjlA [Paraferrimonas sedimenticola]